MSSSSRSRKRERKLQERKRKRKERLEQRAISMGVNPHVALRFAEREVEEGCMLHPRFITWNERDQLFLSGQPLDLSEATPLTEHQASWNVAPVRKGKKVMSLVRDFAKALWIEPRFSSKPVFSRACLIATLATAHLDLGHFVPVEWVVEALDLDLFIDNPSEVDLRSEMSDPDFVLNTHGEVSAFLAKARERDTPDLAPIFPWDVASDDGMSREKRMHAMKHIMTRALFGEVFQEEDDEEED